MKEKPVHPQTNALQKSTESEKQLKHKKWVWTLVFLAIAAVSIWAVTSQIRSFSLSELIAALRSANPGWILIAVLCMVGFILFEALALRCICRSFGNPCRVHESLVYSTSDIYFSAITPSATGGQPASAFFMMHNGIPGSLTAVILIANLVMYTLSILTIGVISFLICPSILQLFGTPSKILILIGCVAQIGLACFFWLLLKKEQFLQKCGGGLIHLLAKLRLLRNKENKMIQKLERTIAEYKAASGLLRGHRKMLLQVYVLNVFQRVSQIAVSMFIYLAMFPGGGNAVKVFVLQSCTVLGSNCIPIPGAMGVSDYLMLDGFSKILTEQQAVNLELISRSVSFYICILICGIYTLLKYLLLMKRSQLS